MGILRGKILVKTIQRIGFHYIVSKFTKRINGTGTGSGASRVAVSERVYWLRERQKAGEGKSKAGNLCRNLCTAVFLLWPMYSLIAH